MQQQLYITNQAQANRMVLLLLAFAGFLPVLCIVFHCLDLVLLKNAFIGIIIPVFALYMIASSTSAQLGRLILYGWTAGVVAVTAYDISRIPFLMSGWGDFIPKIGGWVMNTNEYNAPLGYSWRYIGNGGGMGITFFMLMQFFSNKKLHVLNGIIFGWFVFFCLMSILIIFPVAQEKMFKITPLTFVGSLTGHLVYGLILGLLYKRRSKTL